MEVVHKEFWQQNFQISPAENTTFDPDTETEVTQTLQQQHNSHITNNITGQLSPDDPLSRPITPEDMRHAHTRTNDQNQTDLLAGGLREVARETNHTDSRHTLNSTTYTTLGNTAFAHTGTGSAVTLTYAEIAIILASKHQTNLILRSPRPLIGLASNIK